MNSCILMVEIYDHPQLRHTPDGLEVTEMMVQVSGMKPEDPTHPLKVVGWGNLAKEIHQSYHQGDRVIIEGRLGMNTIERPEGFKEKRAELTVQKIHAIAQGFSTTQPPVATVPQTVPQPAYRPTETYQPTNPAPTPAPSFTATVPPSAPEPDPDDIPF
ncbi:single-stranded DNA-binding protein [Cronbergia sp. UHCC 0137]|uniref:single-stranded DNA-binding protein n=1 Tax=Cronbergia sp. UHCC 0137 TaxID=3110239 RepID=UPI002B2023EC|nr:single-stranded DNA-binding protein [Cronbergia sp. UHCC 0137]MEA5618595.1 single-stranded DNA-binding protein [Cronbergia sp. UHCC 0137]